MHERIPRRTTGKEPGFVCSESTETFLEARPAERVTSHFHKGALEPRQNVSKLFEVCLLF